MGNRSLSPETQVIVTSPGGVSAALVVEYVQQLTDVNHPNDDDRLKDLPAPPKTPSKVIFIYGKTNQVAASLTRSGFERGRFRKVGYPFSSLLPLQLIVRRLSLAVDRQLHSFVEVRSESVLTIDCAELWRSRGTGSSSSSASSQGWTRSLRFQNSEIEPRQNFHSSDARIGSTRRQVRCGSGCQSW